MSADDLLQQLRTLEIALHQSVVDRDPARINALSHESFAEFGRSGRSYSRADIVDMLRLDSPLEPVWSQDFAVAEIAGKIVLLTYKSAHIDEKGALHRHALRSSLWQRTPRGWQIRFHQGTPTDAFEKRGPTALLPP